jgi:hypothetical protein
LAALASVIVVALVDTEPANVVDMLLAKMKVVMVPFVDNKKTRHGGVSVKVARVKESTPRRIGRMLGRGLAGKPPNRS